MQRRMSFEFIFRLHFSRLTPLKRPSAGVSRFEKPANTSNIQLEKVVMLPQNPTLNIENNGAYLQSALCISNHSKPIAGGLKTDLASNEPLRSTTKPIIKHPTI